jgi:DNA-binding NtrC family response regulator
LTSTTPQHVLVVDDDSAQRSLLSSFLTQCGVSVQTSESGEEALASIARERPAMLISDVRMPGMTGLELLDEIREKCNDLPVLLVTAHADIRDAVGAMRQGVVDYLEKPIDLEELLAAVQGVVGDGANDQGLEIERGQLPDGLIIESPAMANVLEEIRIVAPSDSRILITGESGTGKEVVADLIHRWSSRSAGPFIKINCAAIPEALLESELFGHRKGAFTGALEDRRGLFSEADGGTLLLDEVGEMAHALQAKLLRVIQDGTYSPVGSNDMQQCDVRILAATNRDLEAQVSDGAFREDLFYRLNVMEIYLPPLRERVEDILPLARQFAAALKHDKARFSPGAIAALEAHGWPGNVRELRNAIERALLLSRGDVLLPEHLPKRLQSDVNAEEGAGTASQMVDIEREAILKTLKDQNFHRTNTAKALGISRRALTYKLQAYQAAGFDTNKPE